MRNKQVFLSSTQLLPPAPVLLLSSTFVLSVWMCPSLPGLPGSWLLGAGAWTSAIAAFGFSWSGWWMNWVKSAFTAGSLLPTPAPSRRHPLLGLLRAKDPHAGPVAVLHGPQSGVLRIPMRLAQASPLTSQQFYRGTSLQRSKRKIRQRVSALLLCVPTLSD